MSRLCTFFAILSLSHMGMCRSMLRYRDGYPIYEDVTATEPGPKYSNQASKPATMSSAGVPCYKSTCATGGFFEDGFAYSWCWISAGERWAKCSIGRKTSMGFECRNDDSYGGKCGFNCVCDPEKKDCKCGGGQTYKWCHVKKNDYGVTSDNC